MCIRDSPSYHREIGGVVCLVLAFFGSFGYFGVKAAFIDLFCDLLRGLCGYGYYLAPPVLVLCAYILIFHRRRSLGGRKERQGPPSFWAWR